MKTAFKNDKYWITLGIIVIILTFAFYPHSPFKSVDVKITRADAEKIAIDLKGE